MGYGWYLMEISAIFLAMGLLSGFANNEGADGIISQFLTGAKDMLSAALVVGLAGGIIQILQDGRIIDPILHSMATLMGEAGKDCFPRSYVPDPDYDQYYYPFRFGEGGIDYADYGTILGCDRYFPSGNSAGVPVR